MKKTTTLLAIGSALAASVANAEVEAEFHVGYVSDYEFRGADLGDNAFSYGLDVGGSCDCGLDWSAGIWHISPSNTTQGVDELDIYGEVSKDVGFGTLALGFATYTYDNSSGLDDDAELYISGSTELAGVSASLKAVFGIDGILKEAILLEGSLAYGFDITEKLSGEVSATSGFLLDEGDLLADDGYLYGTIRFDLSYALSENISLNPYIAYTEGEEDIYGPFAFDDVFGGATLNFTF